MVDFYNISEEVSGRLLQITLGNRFRLYLTVLQSVSCLSRQSSFTGDPHAAAQIAKQTQRLETTSMLKEENRQRHPLKCTRQSIPIISEGVTLCSLSGLKALKNKVFLKLELAESSARLTCEVCTSA